MTAEIKKEIIGGRIKRLFGLKPLPEDSRLYAMYGESWDQLRTYATSELLKTLENTYWRTFEYVAQTKAPMPVSILNRTFNKTWHAQLLRAKLPRLNYTNMIECASVSDSMPLIYAMRPKTGATVFAPRIVEAIFRKQTKLSMGTVDIDQWFAGEIELPHLNEAAILAAGYPFDPPKFGTTPVGDTVKPPSDEIRLPGLKLDSEQDRESLGFPEGW